MMESQIPTRLLQKIEETGVVAVLVIDKVEHAVPLANALLAGGINTIELTLRTPAAIDALKSIVSEVPQITAGIGTILTTQQIQEVSDAGAAFGVAPGLNRRIVQAAKEAGLPFAPGVATPSEIEAALEMGCVDLKFFPAEPSGGLTYLNSMAAPYKHLGIRFIPLGGLNAGNFEDYIRSPLIRAVGGSWLAPSKLIHAEAWQEITDRAAAARQVVDRVRAE